MTPGVARNGDKPGIYKCINMRGDVKWRRGIKTSSVGMAYKRKILLTPRMYQRGEIK